jgi:hypothetical protein
LPTEPYQSATQCSEQESNLQTLGFKPSRSTSWRTWAKSSPGWTRTTDRLLVRELPSPLGHRTARAEARVRNCGSWNRTNIRTFRASRPTVRRSRNCCFVSSGGRNRTYGLLIQSQASLPTATTPEYSVESQSALRELNPPRQLGRLVPLPLGQGHTQRKG